MYLKSEDREEIFKIREALNNWSWEEIHQWNLEQVMWNADPEKSQTVLHKNPGTWLLEPFSLPPLTCGMGSGYRHGEWLLSQYPWRTFLNFFSWFQHSFKTRPLITWPNTHACILPCFYIHDFFLPVQNLILSKCQLPYELFYNWSHHLEAILPLTSDRISHISALS